MADSEFEQFRHYFEQLPSHIKATAQTYTLVHDVTPETSPTSSKSDEAITDMSDETSNQGPPYKRLQDVKPSTSGINRTDVMEGEISDESNSEGSYIVGPVHRTHWPENSGLPHERRRRKLPDIPTQKKSKFTSASRQVSLAEELGDAMAKLGMTDGVNFAVGGRTRPLMMLKTHNYLREEDSSPDVDSGNSTAYSPDGLKSASPQLNNDSISPVSNSPIVDRIPLHEIELLDPTHRGLHKFVTRHHDEIEIEIGDPIYVQKEADDLWCEGVNLRTFRQGIFPSAYVVDVEYSDFDPTIQKVKKERYRLGYLGSVETLRHKGNSVLCQAVKKIKTKDYTPHTCILEISDTGIRMVDRKKPARKEIPCHDYFYSLKNVSFCAFHPRDHRYMGFITKHPHCDRFACHVFIGRESTRPVAEAVGRAFQRFYQTFIETAYPVEDIYIE